jgi:hypothetical protein
MPTPTMPNPTILTQFSTANNAKSSNPNFNIDSNNIKKVNKQHYNVWNYSCAKPVNCEAKVPKDKTAPYIKIKLKLCKLQSKPVNLT